MIVVNVSEDTADRPRGTFVFHSLSVVELVDENALLSVSRQFKVLEEEEGRRRNKMKTYSFEEVRD